MTNLTPKFALILTLISSLPALAGTHKVTYEIPVPEALEPFSRFEVEYTAENQPDGFTEVSYRFPAFVLGSEHVFRFRGQVDFSARHFDLRGTDARMRCEPGAEAATCNVAYSNVKVDLDKVQEALDALPITPAEKIGRFEVASLIARSGGDFAGIFQLVKEPGYEQRRQK